jgi:hypothetical protein
MLVFTMSPAFTVSGCSFGFAAICTILAGIMRFVTAGLCCKTGVDDTANAYKPVVLMLLSLNICNPMVQFL